MDLKGQFNLFLFVVLFFCDIKSCRHAYNLWNTMELDDALLVYLSLSTNHDMVTQHDLQTLL